MSIVPHCVRTAAYQSIIAQSLAKALVHIRFAESVARSDARLAEKLQALRQLTEDLLQAGQAEAHGGD
jgi:hypothetical protein